MRMQERVVFMKTELNVLESELPKRKCCQIRHRSKSCQRSGGGGDAPLKRRMRALVDLHVIFILTLPERNRIVQ